jgi:FSR family fosmidomycin resistance protein-like MFS transporter
MSVSEAVIGRREQTDGMQFGILGALSASHFVNDMMQSLLLSIYPLLKGEFTLDFGQLGLITLTYQLTASLLQPLIGLYTDRHPKPFAASIGMVFTMAGLLLLAFAHRYETLLAAAALIGTGSSVFHPESSRIARFASGGSHGLAQSLFQIGGNAGSAVGPLIAAFIILPYGRSSIGPVALITLIAMFLLFCVALWYRHRHPTNTASRCRPAAPDALPSRVVVGAIGVLLILVFSKYFYLASLSSYYTFYLMQKFEVAPQAAQMYLFAFLLASAAGTLLGGPIGDRVGRKTVIWFSILGVAPFTLALPFADLRWTCALTVVIGFVISSAFSAIVVFAQELAPTRVGLVSGLFFGLAFGFGGLGAAVLGALADQYGIATVYRLCAYLPLLGIVTALLPNLRRKRVSPYGKSLYEKSSHQEVG